MPAAWGQRWQQLCWWVREYFGENDYGRYVAAWQARHSAQSDCTERESGEHRLLSPSEYFTWRLTHKYSVGVTHC